MKIYDDLAECAPAAGSEPGGSARPTVNQGKADQSVGDSQRTRAGAGDRVLPALPLLRAFPRGLGEAQGGRTAAACGFGEVRV